MIQPSTMWHFTRSAKNNGNFLCHYTNLTLSNSVVVTNVVITNWSRVRGVPDEVKLVTVKTTGSGFTNGEMFFGSGSGIGRVSADGTQSNLTWCAPTTRMVCLSTSPLRP